MVISFNEVIFVAKYQLILVVLNLKGAFIVFDIVHVMSSKNNMEIEKVLSLKLKIEKEKVLS